VRSVRRDPRASPGHRVLEAMRVPREIRDRSARSVPKETRGRRVPRVPTAWWVRPDRKVSQVPRGTRVPPE